LITKQNYKLLAEIEALNKSESGSRYYVVSFGKTKVKIRVADHYNNKWKGDLQIVVFNPKNIDINDVKGRSYLIMERKYNRQLNKKKK